jgi:imidazolonepropionase-like amidohydrolase
MKRITIALAAVAAALALASCQAVIDHPAARPPLQRVSLAVTNVTVIDPESRRVLPSRTIFIEGDRIVAVLPAAQPSPFAAAQSIDGSGKFVIPGLMDMHFHLFLPEPTAPSLNLLLANGVTGIREMAGDCWEAAGSTKGCIQHYRVLREQIRSGAVAGPDIVRIASPMVMGRSRVKLPEGVPDFVLPSTPEQGRETVRRLHARGADLVKTHDSIPTAVFAAMMDEARKLGMEVGGHVPFRAGSVGAARMGYKSIEHARDPLYDCSRYGVEFRQTEADFADGKPGSKRPESVVRLSRTVDEFDPALCRATMSTLAAAGAFYDPTHVTREMEARAGEANYRADPTLKYVMPQRRKNWDADLKDTAAKPPAEVAALNKFFRHGLVVTGFAHRAGVPIMAGSDANDTMIVPGFSLHREFGLLRQAGLSTMDVLRSATTVPAAYLGQTDRYGGVSPGKEADLVLLNANPLDAIANTADIFAVVANGKSYDRAHLDALLAEVEAMARAPSP